MNIVNVSQALSLLADAKLLAYPTDTIWGLGGLASIEVVKKINNLKKRNNKAGFILITDDIHKLSSFVRDSDDLSKIPQILTPTSWLINVSSQYQFLTTTEKIAVRILSHPAITYELLKRLDTPLISTSLNISGAPPITYMSELTFDVDVLPFDEPLTGSPSRIIDLYTGSRIR